MTMKERISASVRTALRPAVEGERKEEIIEELSANLYAKYTDAVAAGADPEEAYGQAMDSLGDVSELIELAGGSRAKADWNAAMDSLVDMGRTAMNSVRNAAHAAKEPLRDMGERIARAVRDLDVDVTVQSQHQFDYTVPGQSVSGLEVRLRSGDIILHPWDEDTIQVIERSKSSLDEDKHASFRLREDGVLCIEQGNTAATFALFGFGLFSSDLELFLPRKLWRTVELRSTSGDIRLEGELRAASLLLSSTSGDVDLGEGLQCETLELHTVSSGIEAAAVTCRRLQLKTTSGNVDLTLASLPEELAAKTVSGDVTLTLPENDGFAVGYQMVSGNFTSDFDLVTSLNRKEGTATYRAAQAPRYEISSVSGDLAILRQ